MDAARGPAGHRLRQSCRCWGVLNVILRIAAICNSKFVTIDAHNVFGSLKTRGWIMLVSVDSSAFGFGLLFWGATVGRIVAIVVANGRTAPRRGAQMPLLAGTVPGVKGLLNRRAGCRTGGRCRRSTDPPRSGPPVRQVW